jgi:hypothetical protein
VPLLRSTGNQAQLHLLSFGHHYVRTAGSCQYPRRTSCDGQRSTYGAETTALPSAYSQQRLLDGNHRSAAPVDNRECTFMGNTLLATATVRVAQQPGWPFVKRSLGGSPRLSYNEKLWMFDLLKAVTYPPS